MNTKLTFSLAALLLLATSPAVMAESAADKDTGKDKSTTQTYETQPFQQEGVTTLTPGNSVGVGFNGQPATTDGVDHNLDSTISYIAPRTDAVDGSVTYQNYQPTNSTVTYKKEMVNGVWTGTLYRVDTVGGETKWAKEVPAITMNALTVSQITGSAGPSTAGVAVNGIHNDDQVNGGVLNTVSQRSDALEGLIKSVREGATTVIDMSSNNYTMTGQGLGTAENPAVVIAGGKMIDGIMKENDLHFSGTEDGHGILVVEIDDPNKAQFNMSGQSKWTGLVVIAVNKVPTSNKQPLSFVGGGQDVHIIGGVFVYMRNQQRTSSESATLLGVELVKLAGNGNVTFSDQAIDTAFRSRPSSLQVRSWRRVADNE